MSFFLRGILMISIADFLASSSQELNFMLHKPRTIGNNWVFLSPLHYYKFLLFLSLDTKKKKSSWLLTALAVPMCTLPALSLTISGLWRTWKTMSTVTTLTEFLSSLFGVLGVQPCPSSRVCPHAGSRGHRAARPRPRQDARLSPPGPDYFPHHHQPLPGRGV